jgi:predicted unusual protein kinase regulating ubiquinone biosynthesis (AarF/ABC1/UbiB family)
LAAIKRPSELERRREVPKQTVNYIVTVDIDEAKTFLKFCDLIQGVVEYDRERAAEEHGLAALQSGEAPSQQLQAKIRLSLEQIKGAALNGDMPTVFRVLNQTYAELSAM